MTSFATGTFTSPADGLTLTTYAWTEGVDSPRGIVQLAHGLAEHSARYDRFAQVLKGAGFLVFSADHRGHGRSITDTPGDFGRAGWPGLHTDLAAFGADLAQRHPGLPIFLFGHSMGSFAAQNLLLEHSGQYAGVVLSGSTAIDQMAAALANAPADAPAGLEAFNAGFEHRTGYEWLSRDEAEVDRYVADPLCGFDTPAETIPALFSGADRLADPEALRGIRPDLPMLIVSGDADPLAGGGQLVDLLGERYRAAGLTDVTVSLYPQARHEILNETNRDEITGEIVEWLAEHTPQG